MRDGDLIQYEGGEVLASLEDRTITGLLIPFNELGQTNAGRFMVEAEWADGALPADPTVISLNLDHQRDQTVARASRVWVDENVGIMATYQVANTPEGDAALADALDPNGKRRRLSGEFHTAIKAGKAVPGTGRVWGGALVPMGAFPSAMVLAEDRTAMPEGVTQYTDAAGATWQRVETTETAEAAPMTPDTTVPEETTPTEEEGTVPEETTTVEAGAVPATLNPSGAAPAATTIERAPSLQTIFASIATMKSKLSNPADRRAARELLTTLSEQTHTVLAALQDITPGGSDPLLGTDVLQHNWVGQIAQGVPYVREYIGLCNLGNDITLGGKKGFKVKRGTSGSPVTGNFDGTYTGNKSAVASYQGFTTAHESVLDQFAIAEDIARAFYDLPGGTEAVAAFLALVVEDHLVWSDETALAYIVATAGSPVAPATAKYSANYPAIVGQIIQGILAVRAKKTDGRRDIPSFSILNDSGYEALAYAAGGEENMPAFVKLAVSTASNGKVDADVEVVVGDIGIDNTDAAIVGAGYAIDFDEPAGGPLLVDALDIANAGMDKAVHGYLQTFVKRPEAVVLIGTADA